MMDSGADLSSCLLPRWFLVMTGFKEAEVAP